MRISVKSDINQLSRKLSRLQKQQLPYATSLALNDTAFGLQQELNASTTKYMDRPIPFTKRAMRVRKATKRNLMAKVYVADMQWSYLQRIVEGSSGQPRVVPVAAKTNAYGNLGRGYVSGRRNKDKFFAGRPNNRKGMGSGLYQVMGGKRNKRLKLHASFERSTTHGRVWPYTSIATRYVNANFSRNLNRSLARAMRSAR